MRQVDQSNTRALFVSKIYENSTNILQIFNLYSIILVYLILDINGVQTQYR